LFTFGSLQCPQLKLFGEKLSVLLRGDLDEKALSTPP
jgi:hypothetical protein